MYGDFLLLESETAPAKRAERLAFGETSGRDERWLRDTLFVHPELLPIREIDPTYGPLIPLCTELRTEAGPLDIAFINSYGRLTLVECKLWRNPEARRKVVAQVLDYARAISKWSYSDLQRQVSAATGKKGNVPFELASSIDPRLTEHRFVDDVSSSMRSGRFLLLIAGDGIREDVGSIAELINRNAATGFSFGLVEVGLYGLEDGGLIVQPRTVAKTQTIERTVVLVRDGSSENFSIVDEVLPDEMPTAKSSTLSESPKQAEYRAWWAPVMEMAFDDPDQESPKLFWPNHVRAPLPRAKTWLAAYRYGGNGGNVGVYTSGSGAAYANLIKELEPYREEIISQLPERSEFKKFDSADGFAFSTVRPVQEFPDDDGQRKWLEETLNTYANVFRAKIRELENSVESVR